MARMRQLIGLTAVTALSLGVVGCVPQEKYNALKLDNDRMSESLGKAQSEVESKGAEAEAYKAQLAQLMGAGNNRDGIITNLSTQNSELQHQNEELARRLGDAINLVGKGGTALPATLSNELSNFAASNPDLVDFDAGKGIVKFKSDVTFARGDATVTPKAKEVLGKFASILNSAGASGYELLVAGHTDDAPVVNPETIRNGHKDNWYLSAHRAIGVGKELLADGVNSSRLGVVGYADKRPIASNASEGGKAMNRRVEVLILPTSARSSAPSVASTPRKATPAPAAAAKRPVMTKDAAIDNRPVLSK